MRKSPLAKEGDFFMHAEHEKFAPCDLFTITVCGKVAPPLFGREKFTITAANFSHGE